MTYDEVKTILESAECEVKFTKVDGAERIMRCTLVASKLPVYESTGTRKQNTENISVWDTEKNGWRSYKINNIISITVL